MRGVGIDFLSEMKSERDGLPRHPTIRVGRQLNLRRFLSAVSATQATSRSLWGSGGRLLTWTARPWRAASCAPIGPIISA